MLLTFVDPSSRMKKKITAYGINTRLLKRERTVFTYFFRIDIWHVGKKPVIDHVYRRVREMLVDCREKGLNLIAREDEAGIGPVWILDVVDLGRDRGNNAKVMTSASHGPPKLRFLVNSL